MKARTSKCEEVENMIIGMVLGATFPFDIRVEKEARILMKAGFSVHLLCLGQNESPKYEVINGLKVHRADVPYGNIFSRFWNIFSEMTFIHPAWLKSIYTFVKENKIDILHIHDLPLVNTALKVRKKLKTPVIADLHENYPSGLQVWNEWMKNPVRKIKNKVLFNYNRWSKHESKVCSEVDKIIVVVDEMKDRLIRTHQISSDKITVITNTEEIEFVKNAIIYDEIIKSYKDRFIISYIGTYGPHRGLDIVIRGMVSVKREISNALLLIIGKANKDYMEDELKRLVKENNLEQNIEFLGWQPFEKVYSYMYITDIGIIPHNKNEHTDHTVPHKLFQYMMLGKCFVVSSCKPLKRITETINSGLVFEAGNPESFAAKVVELYKNPLIAKNLGMNGQKATVDGTWNWDHTAKELTGLYLKVMKLDYTARTRNG